MMAEGVGGHWKLTDNIIQETDVNGDVFVRFRPTPAVETEGAMTTLCDSYRQLIGESKIERILLAILFVFDFLCIHPFHDGNGRMSRLLTTLLLYRSGFYVGKYISLEAKIAKIKDLYYDALSESQEGWHEGTDDPTPFIKYLLSIIDMAYKDFEERLEIVHKKLNANELVELAFKKKLGKIKKSDIVELCPNLSVSAVEKGIAKLLADGKIEKLGNGKNTFYVKK